MKINLNGQKLATICLLIVTMAACNQDNTSVSPENVTAEDNQAILDETEAVFTYNEDLFGGFSGVREAATTGADSVGVGMRPLKKDNCATITRTQANGVITIVVDYGTPRDCDGRKVGGKMTTQIPLRPATNASGLFTQTITYEKFQRGPRTISGKHSVSLVLENGKLVTKESFTQTSITTENGKTILFNSIKARKTDTKGTPLNANDDEIVITGSTTATGSDGKTFASTITKSIIVKVACKATSGGFPVMGIIEIVCPEKPKSIVDYGDGSCDRTYTVTTNGVTETKIRK
jgi:hypothetical protein